MTVNTLGTHEQDRSSRTAAEWLWPLMPIGISVFFLSALVYYHLRQDAIEVRSVLQVAVAGIYRVAGFAPAVLCFLLALTWSSIWFATGQLERPIGRLLRLLAMTVMLSVFLNVGDGGAHWYPHKGEFGAWLAGTLLSAFGYLPSLVLVWAVTFASLLLATDFFFSDSFERLRQRPADAGVEVAVTDHLRGLAQSGSPPRPERAHGMELAIPPGSGDPLATPGELASAAGLEPAPEAAAPAPATEQPPVEAEPRRRTYAERRARREQEFVLPPRPDERGKDADAAAEAAADSKEFESSEASAVSDATAAPELATPTAEAGIVAGAEVESDEEWTAPAAAGEQFASEDSDDLLLAGAVEEDEEEADAADEDDGADDVHVLQPGDAARDEPLVQIPRLDAPPVWREPTAPGEMRGPEGPPERAGRQQELFAAGIDEALIEEAIELVTSTRRASATLLQRKLRIDYARAMDLLAELAARGLVALEDDASQGRVLGQ